jgi:CHAD domain-containing protein
MQMRAWVSDAALLQLLTKEREQAWKKLGRGLTSPRYAKLVKLFSAGLRRGITTQAAHPVHAAEAAPPLLKKQFKKFRQSAESLTPASLPTDYHALRIRGKHFRYTVEFFSPLYEDAQELLTRLVALQDVLGALQDAETALPRLAALREEHGAALAPPTLWALGELTERYTNHAAELRTQVPRAFKKLQKRWKRWRKNLRSDEDETVDRAAR